MRQWLRSPTGLLGRIFVILLLTVLVEFAVHTLLYERASQFSVKDDEAHRLAEHLVIARKLLAESPPAGRAALADELTTSRYEIIWRFRRPELPPISPSLDRMRNTVLGWEPELRNVDLRVRLQSPSMRSEVIGDMLLPDRTVLMFRMRHVVGKYHFAFERVAIALTPALALILIGGLLLRRTLTPLRELSDAADGIGDGKERTVRESGTGEIRRLIAAFNRMQHRIHRLIADRTQALAAVGHDMRTPLARLRLRADLVEDAELRDAIQDDVVEMEAMILSLLTYLGGDEDGGEPKRVDVAVLCASLVDDAVDRCREARYEGPEHCEMLVRPVGIKRALANLVDNALHYADAVVVTLAPETHVVRILVEDDGPGIPEDKLEQVVQPFVRLDSARARDTKGFGLGLAIVARAVRVERGTLVLRNRTSGGLSAEIKLPAMK